KNESLTRSISEAGARVVVDAKPSSSQQAILDQFLQNAAKSAKLKSSFSVLNPSASAYISSSLQPTSSTTDCGQDVSETKEISEDSISTAPVMKLSSPTAATYGNDDTGGSNEPLFILNDGNNLSQLLHVANDMDLTFTYNSRRMGEFCFESNGQDMRGRSVVFADLGTKISIRERLDGNDMNYEEWSKADWKQFLWAVRGKCMNILRGI
ncbi:unnamed protein product, partial [Thelazia callipaeda]|uniref:BPL/LPL catalytic domain-containing protein n=1 Tax=Thelazia callipaeda TaxID=103827 RepID=A0A0N5CQ90_THECL